MRRNFNELRETLGPERRTRVELRAREAMAEVLRSEIEVQPDMTISALRPLVEAAGGCLELIAHLPRGVRLSISFKARHDIQFMPTVSSVRVDRM